MLVARLFGAFELQVGSRTLGPRDLGGTKPKQVLEILLIERGRPVTKDRLADLLWGESLPQNASATLDTYASVLRRHIEPDRRPGGLLVARAGVLQLTATELEVDLDRFDTLVGEAARSGVERPSPRARRALEDAIALVRGEVLEDEPYADWALRLRDTYRERYLQARVEAADQALLVGDAESALAHARAVLEVDRARERAHRLIMVASYQLGRQEAALRAYANCRLALDEELGVDPLPETIALHGAIVRHEDLSSHLSPTRPASAASGKVVQPAELPLLGRATELASLVGVAGDALSGAGGLVFIEGEAGIGKSRMLSEVIARLGPVRIGRAKCSELDRDVPFAPMASALRSLGVDAARARERGLADILPEAGVSSLPPEASRARALEGLAGLIVEQAPVALVIDDLQWADASTLSAISYLQRRTKGTGVLLLGAFRTEEAPHEHPVRRLEPALQVLLGPLTSLDLAGLGADLFRRTGGHPLFVVELVRAGADGGTEEMPATLSEVIIGRCRAAGPASHRLLAVASVMRRPFEPRVLAAMIGEDEVDLAEQAEALCERRLLRIAEAGFDFRHDLIREALLATLSPARRRLLHARALQALADAGSRPGELAFHALEAGVVEAAMRYSIAAGDAARAGWANVEAAEHYGRARALVDEHPELLEAELRERLLLALGRVLVTLGRVAEAEAAIRDARASAERRGDDRAVFEALEAHGVARQRGASDPVQALSFGRNALAVAERLGDPYLLSRAHVLIGSPSGSIGLLDDEITHCSQALAYADKAGRAPAAFPMGRIALGLHHQGKELEALRWATRAEDAALEQHDEETVLMARWTRALASLAVGRSGESWAALDACGQVGKGEEIFWHARVPNTYGSILADLCQYDQALDRDLESLAAAQSSALGAVREAEFQTRLNLATNYLNLGYLDRARAEIAIVRAGVSEVEYARFRWLNRLHCVEAELAAVEGDTDRSLAAVEACLGMASSFGQPKYEVRGKLAMARALRLAGDLAGARREARSAAERADQLGFLGLSWRCWWAVSELGDAAARRRAQTVVAQLAADAPERLREPFLAAVAALP